MKHSKQKIFEDFSSLFYNIMIPIIRFKLPNIFTNIMKLLTITIHLCIKYAISIATFSKCLQSLSESLSRKSSSTKRISSVRKRGDDREEVAGKSIKSTIYYGVQLIEYGDNHFAIKFN